MNDTLFFFCLVEGPTFTDKKLYYCANHCYIISYLKSFVTLNRRDGLQYIYSDNIQNRRGCGASFMKDVGVLISKIKYVTDRYRISLICRDHNSSIR